MTRLALLALAALLTLAAPARATSIPCPPAPEPCVSSTSIVREVELPPTTAVEVPTAPQALARTGADLAVLAGLGVALAGVGGLWWLLGTPRRAPRA